ncbi:uncharacterized protein TNCV_1637201 [Trichonephila clavipes]|nr:uncharacterized protein TNCV_1637201 [Trichonephila clavipes]
MKLEEILRLSTKSERNIRWRQGVQIKVNDWVLGKTHPINSRPQKVVAKFKPKFERPYRLLKAMRNNLVVRREVKSLTVNVDQVKLYHLRKSDDKEIRTSSFDSNSSRYKSSKFEGVQPRPNESQYSRNNGSGERRDLEKKGICLKKDQGERQSSISSNRRPLVRSSPGSWTEPNRRTKKSRKETLGYKRSSQAGSGVPERKYRKGLREKGAKRKLTSVNSNDLPYFRKKEMQET